MSPLKSYLIVWQEGRHLRTPWFSSSLFFFSLKSSRKVLRFLLWTFQRETLSVCIHGWFGLTAPISQKGSLWPTAKSVDGRRQHSHSFWQTPNRRLSRQYCYLAQEKFCKSLITCPPDVNTFSHGTVCFWNDPRPPMVNIRWTGWMCLESVAAWFLFR